MVFAHMCLTSTSYTLLSWLPTYFQETFPHAKVCVLSPSVEAREDVLSVLARVSRVCFAGVGV